jgi:hypothetical protein
MRDNADVCIVRSATTKTLDLNGIFALLSQWHAKQLWEFAISSHAQGGIPSQDRRAKRVAALH